MIALAAAAAVLALGAVRAPAGRRLAGAPGPHSGAQGRARPAAAWLVGLVTDAGYPPDVLRRWPAARLAIGGLLVATGLLGGPVAALLLGGGLAAAPRFARPWLRARRGARRDQQLPAWLERLASGLRGGLSLPAAVSASATTAPWPLRAELMDVEAILSGGMGLGEALSRWRRSPTASPAVALATSALELGARSGGSVAQAVDRVAATLRDRIEAQAEVRALATQARASATLLSIAPLGFTILLATVEPGVVRVLLTTPLGWACLACGLGLDALGAAWMSRIVRQAG